MHGTPCAGCSFHCYAKNCGVERRTKLKFSGKEIKGNTPQIMKEYQEVSSKITPAHPHEMVLRAIVEVLDDAALNDGSYVTIGLKRDKSQITFTIHWRGEAHPVYADSLADLCEQLEDIAS